MREKWAIFIVLSTGLLVLLLAMLFAFIQNRGKDSTALQSEQGVSKSSEQVLTVIDAQLIEQGRKLYQEQSCAMCHSLAGEGNPRSPLDDIATRRTVEELRDWITGSDKLKDSLSSSTKRIKQKYQSLSDHELDALISYLRH